VWRFPNSNYNVAWNSTYGRYENRVGRYDSTWGEGRAELQFDLSPVMGSTVWGADLNMYFFHAYTVAPTWFRVQHLNCGWNAATVTWNNQPCWSGQIADSTAGRGQWGGVDITSWVAKSGVRGVGQRRVRGAGWHRHRGFQADGVDGEHRRVGAVPGRVVQPGPLAGHPGCAVPTERLVRARRRRRRHTGSQRSGPGW
jgi:hypothetical protein